MKSRISGDRAFRIRQQYKDRISSIFGSIITFRQTLNDLTESMRKSVWEVEEVKRCPETVRAYLHGYFDARWDNLWRYHFAWLLWCDDKLMTKEEVDQLTRQEDEDLYRQFSLTQGEKNYRPKDYRPPWSRIDSDKSRHVWKDRDGTPIPTFPVDAKWRQPITTTLTL